MKGYEQSVSRIASLYSLLAINLVDKVTALRVDHTVTLGAVIISARCADCDYGRLIGNSGRMHNACQTILRRSLFAFAEKRIDLIIDAPHGVVGEAARFTTKDDWDMGDDVHMAKLLREAASAIFTNATVVSRRISHSASTFTLQLNEQRRAVDESVYEALNIWFTVAGRAHGRMVYMDVV